MITIWQGIACFVLSTHETTVLIDPWGGEPFWVEATQMIEILP
jgi:L-ascorbate metabolism protein UlaG (beta-lactamase superfamily)